MKTGRTLTEIATEIERQAKTKKDYIADTRRLAFEAKPDQGIVLQGVNGGMTMKPIAHAQMAGALQIPKPYYDRMLTEAPDLLARNVNVWLEKQPAKKLVRTLDNEVRAILSDSYRPLDNLDLAEAVLPKLLGLGARIESAEVTDNRFYLKAVTERVQGAVKVGDTIYAGVVVSNSEVGQGKLRIEEMDFRLQCLNGMIRAALVAKAHLGRSSGYDALEDAREFFRTETRIADDRAFFLKVEDAVGATFNQDKFNARILQYAAAAATPIEADPIKVVEFTAKRFNLNEGEQSSVMRHLINGGDLSVWGLANAVTAAAKGDELSYDRASELEALGGDIIELPKSAWRIKDTKPLTVGAV